ncbi:putative transcription factor NAM family [Helianthus debilis subsp. tardiflorus]
MPNMILAAKQWWKAENGIIIIAGEYIIESQKMGRKAWDHGEEGIVSSNGDHNRIGVTKYYVFHIGEAPQGNQTNWIMEEFRAVDSIGASTSGGSSKKRHHLTTKLKSYLEVILELGLSFQELV